MKVLTKIRKKFLVSGDDIRKHSGVFDKLLDDKKILKKGFFLQGNNGRAVILIHGWSSTPYTIRKLGEYLHQQGYTVIGPRLTGHGTKPEDLQGVKWQEWLDDIEKVYKGIVGKYNEIFVAGTSLGGNLAILLASKFPKISGLILLATPYKPKARVKTQILMFLAKLFRIKLLPKYYPASVESLGTAITPMVSYQKYPPESVRESIKCILASRQKMKSIKQPCLIIQSVDDHMILPKSADKIYQSISSKIKEKKYLKNTYHSFISDKNSRYVFKDIYDFLKKQR